MKKTAVDIDIKNASVEEVVNEYEKKLYDLSQLLEISRSLCSTLDFANLIEANLYTCMCQMRVLAAGIFVLDNIDTNAFNLGSNYTGFTLDPEISYSIPFDSPVIEILNVKDKVFSLAELKKALKRKKCPQIESLNPSLIVPMFQKNHINGILLLGERMDLGEGVEYSEYEVKQILDIASLSSVAINNAALVERSSIDMLTHLKLKFYFFNSLTDELDLAVTQNMSLAVIMFDIDFFKNFNDTWGHACGDYVLQMVAKIMKDSIRDGDLASRYGGEEFTILLPATARESAVAVAERVRTNIENTDFCYEGQHMRVTISGGVSVYDSEKNPVTSANILVDQADKALYLSKRNGRNKITYANPELVKDIEIPE